MGVREYICKKTGTTGYEVYVHLRSKVNPEIRIQKYKRCKTKTEADRNEKTLIRTATEELKTEEDRGSHWKVLVTKWELEARKLKRNPATLKPISEKSIMNAMSLINIWTQDWMDRPCKELSIKEGKDLLMDCVSEDLKSSTIRKLKTTVNLVFRFGSQEGFVDRNQNSPVHGVPFDLSDKDSDQEILTVDEVKTFLLEAKVQKHPWYPVWAVALMTGMRSSELYALRKDNIFLEEGFIRVKESWDWINKCAKSTKAGYWRTAPIASALKPIIEELMIANPESPFLFPRFKEWERGEQAIVVRAFCEKIGIRSVRFHTLRACFATHLLIMGVDQATIMAIGGWSNLKTFRIYVRLAGVTERSKTDGLGQLFVPNEQSVLEHISRAYTPVVAA
jgi:integrase